MACDQGGQGTGNVKGLDFIEAELQKLKEFDAQKINTLPKIQVKGTAARPPRHRMQVGLHRPTAPRKRDVVAATYGVCPSANQFGDDKTNLPTTDMVKLSRKRLEKLPRFRI